MLGLGGVIVFFFVNENFVPVKPDPNAPRFNIVQGYKLMFSQKTFVATLLILSLVQFANSVISPVLALFIQVLNGTSDGAATLAGLELGITGIASACSAAFAGRLSDKYGHRRVLFISALAAACLYFPQAIVGNVWELLILRGLMGLFFGGIIPSANALISQQIPEGRKGAAYGLVNGINSIGFAAGPVGGALIAAILSTRAVFVVTAVILLGAAFYIRRVLARPSQEAEELEAASSDHIARTN
jgi:DHA1 family multidrug resistance protein-like MFS transporter